jgi:hypothetical protein
MHFRLLMLNEKSQTPALPDAHAVSEAFSNRDALRQAISFCPLRARFAVD